MKRWITRFGYGLSFAIPLMLLTFAIAQAETRPQEDVPPQAPGCPACHEAFQQAWEHGDHGKASTDPAFVKSWEAQGSPTECLPCHVTGYDKETNTWESDGITCLACHGPALDNHPQEPMPAERSAKLCGECHSETMFEWQVSAHRENGLDCSGCHDPHATDLKSEDPAALCASCHRERSSNFAHSEHSQAGLNCADCHLSKLTSETEMGHARLDHSFSVKLSACNSCHVYQMHDPIEVHPENPTPLAVDAMASVEAMGVVAEPVPANPIGFTVLAGLIGVALGIVVAPWIEKFHKNDIKDDHSGGES